MFGVTPAFLLFILILCITVLSVQKKYIMMPMIVAMCFLPSDQKILIGTLDFQGLRILALVGIIKIYLDSNRIPLRLNIIDKLFIAYNSLGAIIYVIASQHKLSAFLYKGGVCIDSIILYLVFRHAIQSKETIRLITKTFCICIIALLPFTIFEFYSAQNLFAFLGRSSIAMRHGEIRAAATFSHAILFGSFAAAVFPIFWADYKIEKNKLLLIALLSCIFIVYTSSSSGPIVALAVAICSLCFFKWKHYSSIVFRTMLIAAIAIHFLREKPIWHLVYVRLSVKASSTGYYRYQLVDTAIKEFWHWCLIGYGDAGAQWHLKYWPWAHATFTDITNEYLLIGVRGGFATMVIFLLLCFTVIKTLGAFSLAQKETRDQWLWWGYTVMMITHCVSFLSVGYFGQITMLLFLTIAIASFAYDESTTAKVSARATR